MSIPREGVHVSAIWSGVERTLLNIRLLPLICVHLYFLHGSYTRLQVAWLVLILVHNLNSYLSTNSYNNWTNSDGYDFDNDVIVVTGGSSGIGENITKLILAEHAHAKLAIIDIVAPPDSIASKTQFYQCDMSDSKAVEDVAQQILSSLGAPSVLINNAGLSRGQLMTELQRSDVTVTLGVNLISPFLLIRAFLPAMVKRNHGHILNISSLSALIPPAGLADYAASKAGLLAMSDSIRLELRHKHHARKVRVSSIVLSFTKTPLFKGSTNTNPFVLPLLDVDTVGEEIYRILKSGRGEVLYQPRIIGILAGNRGWPSWLQELFLNESVKTKVDFRGRQEIDASGKVVKG